MAKHLFLFVLLAGFTLHRVSAQHNLNNVLTDTAGQFYTQTNAASVMYEGVISNNFIRFRKLDTLKDGEIKYVLQQKSFSENIILKLNADTGTLLIFTYTLLNGAITYQYPGKNASAGTYKVGDELKIVRCKKGIQFYKNGILVDAYPLKNNNFVMYGEVALIACNRTLANISFKPY